MIVATSLTRFQRILLGADGTVTHILEAYADETIEAVKLLQQLDTADEGEAALDVAPGSTVLRRRVLLRGVRSGRTLLYAQAAVVPERVGVDVLEGLISTNKPIGRILSEHRTETFRRILEVDRERAGACASYFGIEPSAALLYRTYVIASGRAPIMLITEKFPAEFFRDLPA
ncbi:MAG: chorismate--pyruvate lyase family protein [Acidimicrobiales bacterium]